MKPKRPAKQAASNTFVPTMDWWIAAGIVCLLLALLAAIPYIALNTPAWQQKLAASCGLIAIILYVVDGAFFTRYQLRDEGLVIISQLHYVLIPYREMKEIRPSGFHGLISFGKKKRFALSANCLAIYLRKNYWSVVTVSPKKRDAFVDQLLKRIDHERSKRATVIRDR